MTTIATPEWKITMPIDTFEHPEKGSVIEIVSVIHTADPGFYRKIGEHVMARQADGFEVHYEEIAASDDSELKKGILGGIKAKVYDMRLDVEVEGSVSLMMSLGYVDQPREGLFHEEGSKNYDLADAEILAKTRLTTELKSLLAAFYFRYSINRALKKGPDDLDRYAFGKLKKSIDRIRAGTRRERHQDKLILNKRNEVALEGVDGALAEDSEAKVVLIWGLGHFAGLSAGLQNRGYSHIERQEVAAITSRVVRNDVLDKSQKELQKLQIQADKAKAKANRLEKRYSRR